MKYFVTAFMLMLGSSEVLAERFDITAKIGDIRFHEASNTLAPGWRSHTWFALVDPNKSPDCNKYGQKYAITIPEENSTAISLLLSAKMADKEVLITIDDDVKFPVTTSNCKLQYITLK